MPLIDILPPGRVAQNVRVRSKKRALEHFSEVFAGDLTHLTPQEILNSLLARERLGTTALGNGIAIPHARLPNADQISAAFLHTAEPIDYGALDEQPVDLLLALVVPDSASAEYLETLRDLAAILSDKTFCQSLRDADSDSLLYKRLTGQ